MSIAMSAAQAYAAAVSNAIGVHMDSFPLTPDKILAAIKEKEAQETQAETVVRGKVN
jgi:hypothetical protein